VTFIRWNQDARSFVNSIQMTRAVRVFPVQIIVTSIPTTPVARNFVRSIQVIPAAPVLQALTTANSTRWMQAARNTANFTQWSRPAKSKFDKRPLLDARPRALFPTSPVYKALQFTHFDLLA
jgi:hypothetical protein